MQSLKMKRFEWEQIFNTFCLNQKLNSLLISSDYLGLKP